MYITYKFKTTVVSYKSITCCRDLYSRSKIKTWCCCTLTVPYFHIAITVVFRYDCRVILFFASLQLVEACG
jgi:hypothetical protein